jgi:hypothetical protein
MKLKLINYNKHICKKGKHRVIIDDIVCTNPSNEDSTPSLTILFGNELGVLSVIVDTVREIDILSQIYKSCNLSIPNDYIIETEDLKYRLSYLILEKDIVDNNFTNKDLRFELFPILDNNKSELNDPFDLPF